MKKEKRIMMQGEKRFFIIFTFIGVIIIIGICVYGFIKHPFLSFATNPFIAFIFAIFS